MARQAHLGATLAAVIALAWSPGLAQGGPPSEPPAEDPAKAASDSRGVRPHPRARPPRKDAPLRGTQPPGPDAAPKDAARLPSFKSTPVVNLVPTRGRAHRRGGSAHGLGGVSLGLAEPPFVDLHRRAGHRRTPPDFGHTLQPGERFRFDVTFAGNPAGLAEAQIVGVEQDPRGGPPAGAPTIRIEGHARTSGVVSILASVTDDIVTYVDATTGAAISSRNVLHYSGWAPRKYKHRVTEHAYEGRGQVRIVDTKDKKAIKKLKRVPLSTFDPMSAMAWVRSLRLPKGETATAHVVDGTTLMRIEIESSGRTRLETMPSVALAMGLTKNDTQRIDGRITRVDRFDQPIPGKRAFKLRAWLSDDERRVPLVMESDMWVGAIRLELSGYDPPHAEGAARKADPPASARRSVPPAAAPSAAAD